MPEINRNATSTNFGFQFQINVAIYFMFHYLKDIYNIKVEGEKEDIEVVLKDKTKYMIQAKSKTKDIYDNSGNSQKLKQALLSLAEADGDNVRYLFYASNMVNPLTTSTTEFEKYGITVMKYDELSPQSQEKINTQIKNNVDEHHNNKYDIDTNKLVIFRIPFFGEFDAEKYKYIYEEAKNVLGIMSDTLVNKHQTIVKYCESKFLNNSASNPKIKISKEEFCNWIILTEVDSMDLSNDGFDIGIDELDYYEAYQKYQRYIDEKTSSYENYSKVYSLFNRKRQKQNITISEFVKQEKISLYNYFYTQNLKSENEINDNNKFDVYISQIISYAILKKKSVIDRIKKGAEL